MAKFRLLLSIFMLSFCFSLSAQLKDNAIAPNFNLTDINGVKQNLYAYLDSGYTCILDFSATWCGPCWDYHETKALADLYTQYGPGTSDNRVRVFFIEADTTTTSADLNGTGTDTQGDWVSGTPYPIIDLSTNQVADAYKIQYYPTLYMVCPNRLVQELDYLTTNELWDEVAAYCGTKTALFDNDPSIIAYSGETLACDNVDVKVILQNNGLLPLTAAKIKASSAGQADLTFNWTGNLATYAYAEISLGTMSLSQDQEIVTTVTSADDFPDNNTFTQSIALAKSATKNVTLKIVTDQYGADMMWTLKDPSGKIIRAGGPYEDQNAPGEYPIPDINIVLPTNGCYVFTVTDLYADGICCDYGDGSIRMVDAKGQDLFVLSDYAEEGNAKVKLNTTNTAELSATQVQVYPNPTTGLFTVSTNAVDPLIEIRNGLGQIVWTGQSQTEATWQANLIGQPAGQYILSVTTAEKVIVQKIVLTK